MGNEALKKVNELISIEDVEKILDETRESIEKQREIDEMLQGVLTNEDEEDVEKEFEKMMADSLAPQVEPRVPIAEPEEFVSLPEVPSEGNKPRSVTSIIMASFPVLYSPLSPLNNARFVRYRTTLRLTTKKK